MKNANIYPPWKFKYVCSSWLYKNGALCGWNVENKTAFGVHQVHIHHVIDACKTASPPQLLSHIHVTNLSTLICLLHVPDCCACQLWQPWHTSHSLLVYYILLCKRYVIYDCTSGKQHWCAIFGIPTVVSFAYANWMGTSQCVARYMTQNCSPCLIRGQNTSCLYMQAEWQQQWHFTSRVRGVWEGGGWRREWKAGPGGQGD